MGWKGHKHEQRRVSYRAILDKLQECLESGINVDQIPLSLTVGELIRLPVTALANMAEEGGEELLRLR